MKYTQFISKKESLDEQKTNYKSMKSSISSKLKDKVIITELKVDDMTPFATVMPKRVISEDELEFEEKEIGSGDDIELSQI